MKFVLHGATNGSNYGDCLFADIFYHHLIEKYPNDEFVFLEMPKFGIGKFYRENIGYTTVEKNFNYRNCDALIYFSGGYWGEQNSDCLHTIRRYVRYFIPGTWCRRNDIPIAVIGVGGGPISSKVLKKAIKEILNSATTITVRDEETKEYFLNWGVNSQIEVTTDTALIVEAPKVKEKKLIFLHVDESLVFKQFYCDILSESLKKFLSQHDEYKVIVGHDQKCSNEIQDLVVKDLGNSIATFFYYDGIRQFENMLGGCSLILTPKLHAGIMGASFGKSVISFPVHAEKTLRFYRQIGELERCVPMDLINIDKMDDMLNQFYDKKIDVSKLKKIAYQNISSLDEFIEKVHINRKG